MVDYIATLNTVPAEGDLQPEPSFLEDDLAMFTNANFFDFDLGQQDADLPPTDYSIEGRRDHAVAPEAVDLKPLDFMNAGQYASPSVYVAITVVFGGSGSGCWSVGAPLWLLLSALANLLISIIF